MGSGRRAARAATSAPGRATGGFWRGLTFPFKGMAFVYVRHPDLIRIWIFPIALTAIVMGLMLWGAWEVHEGLVTSWLPEPEGEGVWVTVGRLFHGMLELIVFVVLAAAGLVLVVVLTSVIAAPFNDALSERVECLQTGKAAPPFRIGALLKDVVRTIGLELSKIALYAIVVLPLWVLSFVSGPGAIVYSIISFVLSALYFAIDYVDWPAARRDKGIRYRFGLALRRFWPMFGFGLGVWALLFIPLVNLLFMPGAVAGGTLLYLALEGEK